LLAPALDAEAPAVALWALPATELLPLELEVAPADDDDAPPLDDDAPPELLRPAVPGAWPAVDKLVPLESLLPHALSARAEKQSAPNRNPLRVIARSCRRLGESFRLF
jgi:hypothetical protein